MLVDSIHGDAEQPLPDIPLHLPPIPPISLDDITSLARDSSSPKSNHTLPRTPSDVSLPPPDTSLLSPATSGNNTPISPSSPGGAPKLPKKPNPLVDLVETEKTYVDLLGGIIRVCESLAAVYILLINKIS